MHPSTCPDRASTPPEICLRGIFYDLDGTLVNSDPLHYQIWFERLREHGLVIDEAFYKSRISGRLNPAIVADLLPHLSSEARDQFIEQKEAQFRQQAPVLTATRGLSEVIAWADDRNLKQAVVTNAPAENARHMLRVLDLETRFDLVVIADELGIGKPDPAPYLHALKGCGLEPSQAIAFEDSPSGIRSAVAAGILTVGIASTQTPEALSAIGASLVIDDFAAPALWELLQSSIEEFPSHS